MADQTIFEKTDDELRQALKRQVANMRRSMTAFDDGAVEEAERMAQSCYVLLHDGGKSHSLLGQLGLKKAMMLPDSSLKLPLTRSGSGVLLAPPLTVFRLDEAGAAVSPLCHTGLNLTDLPWLKFGKWWEQIIYTTNKSLKLKRMNLIFSMRNQDGGGHVDRQIDNEGYHWLAVDVDPRARMTTEAGQQPITGAHWASMRQIAWEVDQALREMGL